MDVRACTLPDGDRLGVATPASHGRQLRGRLIRRLIRLTFALLLLFVFLFLGLLALLFQMPVVGLSQ